ncbi:MAG: hypothetical protein HY789_01640 [Deltaproteobacteria bacterium]|nr:hypothetical protein [Deltaproteobacteria bacterium]
MMKRIVLCFLFLIISCLPPATRAADQARPLTAAEVTRIVADRTFMMIYTSEKRENHHIYFARDGRYTILFPGGKVRSSDTWKVETNDNFCLRRALRSGGDTRYITKCGPVTLAGPNALNLHDDKGQLIYTLQFLGNGNLLDQFVK